ncbi:rho guanine nucleotide exchange factor 11 isoform X1 [Tribolium castaneum]|uniref:rho guanine nucleotide exchange factor 11 isoform X1 n=1 Tax=Tribolium castaneum TaxID=7070 RepID=UPI0030FEF1BC
MDNTTVALTERLQSANGSTRRTSPIPTMSPAGRPSSLMDTHNQSVVVVQVVVNRDERGYGMKVSGDNPVYVQSVKEGGAAEKAGLHAGDKIIKVNDVNVISSKHTDVVDLIRSSSQVVLTVQQRTVSQKGMSSPSVHNRPLTTPSRITGPQPVDHEKQYQLQLEKEQHYRLMIEKEQRYIDLLRSQIASSPDEKKYSELSKTEKNLQTLQAMLLRSQNEQSPPLHSPLTPLSTSLPRKSRASPNGNSEPQSPPPLPKRNQRPSQVDTLNNRHPPYVNGKIVTDTNALFLNNEINANLRQVEEIGVRRPPRSKFHSHSEETHLVDNPLYSDHPPPLPPRAPLSTNNTNESDAVNSINKQMSYPLVATCATLVNDYLPNPTHHRTKSSPESLSAMSAGEASRKLIASESMNDLRQEGWDPADTPPGTPPPPYPSPTASRRRQYGSGESGENTFEETAGDCSSPDVSPFRGTNRIIANSSPIHAATPQTTQQPIISMEDDEISDQESSQLEDHGYFKSLSRLWERLPHLAVFMNYILSNSDPNSLLFYLLTDLYKEGNAKEMRKWAFEIHSCFLVPGAPLRLGNVDENIAREIDDVLTREFDKEEILRKIFWKARSRAKEELTKQLVDFQQKRTAGLGTIFGPTDQVLSEIYNDKTKEVKLYESLFLEKLEPFLEEIEKENYDPRRYYTAAALTTVLVRIFGIRPASHTIDRCPTFVNKEKSFRTKFIGRYSRKLNVQGHQYVAQQYYTVIVCNNCHQIIYGIGPQGYQCSVCLINLHRPCVKLYDDSCPGPINKKDRGLGKFIRMRHENNDNRRKHSSHFILMERERRQAEEKDNSFELNESGENKPSQPVSRSGSDRRPDIVREETPKNAEGTTSTDHGPNKQENETSAPDNVASFPQASHKKKSSSNINRSESVKEQSEKRKQRRNISDPSHNTTSGDVELDQPGLSNTDSGSSSNSSISYNGRLSESPSNSVDVVTTDGGDRKPSSDWESDAEMEPANWQKLFPEEELRNLQPHEKKRQDVINELFHTESSHVRNLRVLCEIFYKTLKESQVLKPDEIALIFPNIKEMLDVHTQFNREMKRIRREDPLVSNLGDMLVKMFGGVVGDMLKRAAAVFCERQQQALEFIKERRKRDSKFDGVLVECEKKRQCRRLPLQGIIPTEMQRLSKYPLLLERLISSVEANTSSSHAQEELVKLKRAHHFSKDILNHVNEAAKVAFNKSRLDEIQRHLDTTNFERSDHPIAQEFRMLDLTQYKLIREGNMHLRRGNKPMVPVHVLLLEEAVVILHKEGDKFFLKFFQSGSSAQPQPLSPLIKMSTLLVRNNAACKRALFLFNTSTNGTQMYDLLADDDINRDVWLKHFSDAADAYNRREGKTKRHESQPDSDESETLQEIPSTRDVAERAEAVGGTDNTPDDEEEDEQIFSDAQEEGSTEQKEVPSSSEGGGVHTKVTADEWPLIQPSQVHVEVPPVHTAESRLTPLEQIRRKDEEVRRALEDKEGLVADLLSIPREHFQLIADMASDTQDTRSSKDLAERVLAAVYQVDQLHLAVNEALNVTEASAVSATGGKNPACQSQELLPTVSPPSIPANRVRDVANSLSSQLTTLLSDVKQVEEERDRLRKELFRMRERLHEQQMLHGPAENNVESPTPELPPDLDSIKESPAEPES